VARRLVITVGVSLFTSASWRSEGPFEKLGDYRRWVEDLKAEPERRRGSNGGTRDALVGALRGNEAGLAEWFFWPPDEPLRYSAELATLWLWMGHEGFRDLVGFVEDRYDQVDLVGPSDAADEARVAGLHLLAVLEDPVGLAQVEFRDVLTSRSVERRVEHFSDYLGGLPATDSVDLLVSGGYKAFAMMASTFAASPQRKATWRVIYVHEASEKELIVQGQKGEKLVFDVSGTNVPLRLERDASSV
jgi:hypothetical protein